MNYFAWTALINGIVATICGLVVFLQNPRDKRNRIATLWYVSASWWMYCYCIWQLATNADEALFWCRMLMMGAIFVPVMSYHTSLVMCRLETPRRQLFLRIIYAVTFACVLSNFTPLFISHVQKQMFFPYWPMPGPMLHVFTFLIFFMSTQSLLLLWEFRKKASPLARNQILWFLIAIACGYGGGSFNIYPWYNLPLAPYYNLGITVYLILTCLMFFKLGLLDFRLFFRDTTVHTITSIVLGIGGGAACYLIFDSARVAMLPFVFFLSIPVIYQPTYHIIRRSINRTRLGGIDNYLNSIDSKLGMLKESSFSYDDLARNLIRAVVGTFPVTMASIYFWDEPSKSFDLRAQVGMKNDLTENLRYNRGSLAVMADDPLIEFMTKNKGMADREEFEASMEDRKWRNILPTLQRLEAEVCAPFFLMGTVRGFLALGRKNDRGIFHKEDLHAIRSYQRIGEDIMRYIVGMEHEIRHAALYSHDMNNDTKALVQTLQFLQSPLINNVAKEKIKTILKQAEDVAVRLNQSFQLNRDRSALILKSIRGEYLCEQEDLSNLVKESYGKFVIRAEQAKISFKQDLPKKPVLVNANAGDTIRVIDNLISNAFRYVNAGGKVTVAIEENDGMADLIVSDDGVGIHPDVIEHIWDFGWQVKDSKEGASGLGLALVKQIIDMHAWKIVVGNNVGSKGTRFTIKIPLLKNKTVLKRDAKEEAA